VENRQVMYLPIFFLSAAKFEKLPVCHGRFAESSATSLVANLPAGDLHRLAIRSTVLLWHAVALLGAMLGQFYLVALIGRLVGLHIVHGGERRD
jgi:hypothetical protein